MLDVKSLKEYRLLRGLSLRDVARYCDISFQMISGVETGLYGLTESTYKEIVKGINRASQGELLKQIKKKKRLQKKKQRRIQKKRKQCRKGLRLEQKRLNKRKEQGMQIIIVGAYIKAPG